MAGPGDLWIRVATTVAVLAWAALLLHDGWALPAFAVLAWAWGAAVAVDLAHHELPDRYTVTTFPVFIALLVVPALAHGEWKRLWVAVVVGLVTAFMFFVLAFAHPAGLGLGDVKLALSTGAAVGWIGGGWGALRLGLLSLAIAFVLVAVTSLVLLALRRASRASEVAFGPFMIAGVLLTPVTAGLLGW
jgi:leader peptidase (prepilin peptidase) / N-methyltransferase